uniref:Retrotransposon gag domain-containing protein n=1 Tax=Maylandia zebra TaxID=106582 RepID=A0A3P9DS45_9CICH
MARREYNESREDFESYLERLEQWMLANDVSDEKKVCTFLSVIGADTYRLLKNLVSPRVPSTMGYAALTGALSAHYKPTPVVIAERFRFQKRNQKEGEAVSDYVVALRQLSATCDFGQYLDEALRDRFVSGLRSDAVQRKLLLEKDLTFLRACEIAVSMELASKNTMEFSGRQDTHHVNVISHLQHFHLLRKGLLLKELYYCVSSCFPFIYCYKVSILGFAGSQSFYPCNHFKEH